jgi:hypothetical protein
VEENSLKKAGSEQNTKSLTLVTWAKHASLGT